MDYLLIALIFSFSCIIMMLLHYADRTSTKRYINHRIQLALNPDEHHAKSEFEVFENKLLNYLLITLHSLLLNFHLLNDKKHKELSRFLSSAGWRSNNAAVVYLSIRILLPFLLLILSYGVKIFPFFHDASVTMMLWVNLFAVTIGVYAPEFIVKKAIKRYQDKIRFGLPDALDLMVICFEAGYSNDAALKKVAAEYSKQNPFLADEFEVTATELRLLPDRKLAWSNLGERLDLPEIHTLVTAMQQNDKYGTPLATALRTQIELLRKERILKAEEKAAKLPVVLTIPLLFFFFPIILVIVLTPSIIRTIHAFQTFNLPGG